MSRHIILLLVAVWAALACSREPSGKDAAAPGSPWDGTSLSITVGAGTKTMLSGRTPVWVSDDVLTVFDADAAAVPFANASGAGAVATFSSQSWTGKAPVYAAFSGGEPACNVYSGVLTVTIPAEQVVQDPNSFARRANPSIGTVTSAGDGYSISVMKNVAALLEFSFEEDTEVCSVRIEGCNGETIAGAVSASASDANAHQLSSGAATAVILTPSGSAASSEDCFLGGVKYYAAVLPGSYSGFRLTLTDVSGASRVKTIAEGVGLTLQRDRVYDFGQAIDIFPSVTPPSEFIVSLDFTSGWPFQRAFSSEGIYSYAYPIGGNDQMDLRFTLSGQCAFDGSALSFASADGRILLPQVSGRYLNSVVVVHKATGSKTFRLHKSADNSQIGNDYQTHDWHQAVPVAKFSPHTAERCYLALADAADVTQIFLRYTSSAGGSDAVKLGYEWNASPWNDNPGQGDGSIYTYDPDNFFSGIVNRRQPDGTWSLDTAPDPYVFTQTVNDVVYTFESIRPKNWTNSRQRLWNWEAGIWCCDYGDPNVLRLPRTGKLVWAGVVCRNAYNATKNRQVGILSKKDGDSDFTTVGAYTFLSSEAQGSGDGSTLENSAASKSWILTDEYDPLKDYYISCLAGSTALSQLVFVYL